MQLDFHYYATYCAAFLAGYSHEESLEIGFGSQFTDECTGTLLIKLKGPMAAATTQTQMELMEARTDRIGLQNITRIWASFHFLPADLYADVKGMKRYRNKYRLICGPNGSLLADTVELAKGRSLQAAGIAMHVLADTWAHTYFAGTPSLVINNTDAHFYEIMPEGSETNERRVVFAHNPVGADDCEKGYYVASIRRNSEYSIMNLGHGRAGHLPDYSFIKYRYLPAWGGYREIIKDNPHDYYMAFTQMVFALKYLRGVEPVFETGRYAELPRETEERIRGIIGVRRTDASEGWKALGEELSGQPIPDFDITLSEEEYMDAEDASKDDTVLGRYFIAAMAQKSMVTNKIFTSGSRLAGISVDYKRSGFRGIRDYKKLMKHRKGGRSDD